MQLAHTIANTPRALLAQLATAIRFLTVLPVAGDRAPVGQSALFFPLVGLGLGGLLVLIDAALGPVLPDAVRNVLLVAVLAAVTGGRHLRGLATTAGSLLARDRTRGTAGIRDVTAGALGVAAVVIVLALKIRVLDALPGETRSLALLSAPMLARWSIVALAFGSRPARREDGEFTILQSVTFREFALASTFAFALTLANTEARGLVAILVIAVITIGCRVLAHRRLGGITADLGGAIAELNEALVLVVFALQASPRTAVV